MSGSDFTRTQNIGLYKPTPNADTGTWGIHLNSNADTLDGMLATSGPAALFLPIVGGQMTGLLTVASVSAPIATQTGTAYTVAVGDYSLILQPSAAFTLTLPAAAPAGRLINLKLIAAFAVNSSSANVVPLAGGAAGTAILPATAGKYCMLQSDGTSWQIMRAN